MSSALKRRCLALTKARIPDFYRLHSEQNGCGWCHCVAWWVPTWEAWSERTAEENRHMRDGLFARGELDGYLLYERDEPVAWCQVGPRDRLAKLAAQFALPPDPSCWAISCLLVAPHRRGTGLARELVEGVLSDLERHGVPRVEAFPSRTASRDPLDHWTGPEPLFLSAGFVVLREHPSRPVLAKGLGPSTKRARSPRAR